MSMPTSRPAPPAPNSPFGPGAPSASVTVDKADGGGMRIWFDLCAAAALGLALLCVFFVDWALGLGRPRNGEGPSGGVQVKQVEQTKEEETTTPVKRLRLAVTPAHFDDMGRLLRELGEGYAYDEIPLDALLDLEQLQPYDVVFLTCGGSPEHWLGEAVGVGNRNSRVYTIKPDVGERLRKTLRAYVENGGTLYASDWRFQELLIAFPDLVDRSSVVVGGEQRLDAEVVDEGLRDLLGSTVPLNFDQPGWYPAAFRSTDLKSYLHGDYQTNDGGRRSAPLLVRLPVGRGSILYTAFHNESVNSEIETKLLKYLVFTTVTAREQSKVTQTLVQGGFSPQKQNLLSTSASNPTVTNVYRNAKQSDLKFVLAFENQGATLRLRVEAPDGSEFAVREGTSTLQVDVPAASAGDWKYTVTALKVPYENFPFTLTVGQKP
ncbi:MAG: hypothetical protein U0939_00855 [Pirellulales bacterium]